MDIYDIDSHKMQYHIDRTNQWLSAETIEDKIKVFPIYVEISPMGSCNHRCTFCAVDYIGYKNIKLDQWILRSTLLDMGNNGVRSVMFAGEGEPTLHPDLADIINFSVDAASIDVAITTNGTGLNESFINKCLRNISWVKVSCNAGTSKTYSEIHRTKEEDWERVWKNLAYACVKRDMEGLNVKIGVQAVLLPENIDEIEDLVLEAVANGLDYVVIKPYSQHNMSITTKYKDISYEAYSKDMERLVERTSGIDVIWRAKAAKEHDTKGRMYGKCYSTPFLWAYIMASGDLYGCSAYLNDQRFNYGNINDSTFSQIWMGQKRREAIDFVESSLDISECRKNCRMEQVNRYLWDIKNPGEHKNFI